MILIDANLLLHAYDRSSARHAAARAWLEKTLSGDRPVGLCWPVIMAFLRIATNSRALQHPLTIQEAAAIVSEWLARPAVKVYEPGEGHWTTLRGLLIEAQARGPLTMDAHLAALAIEHGLTLCTNDRDFKRFDGLRLHNPF